LEDLFSLVTDIGIFFFCYSKKLIQALEKQQ